MNKKLNKMNNHTYSPKKALAIAMFFAMGFCNLALAQTIPNVSVRLANPSFACATGQYCLDVEFQTDQDSVELFGMNVRFFYDDAFMELDSFADFQGGYGPVVPDPPTVLTSGPGFGTNFFGFPAPGIADWVNGAIQLVDATAPEIFIDTNAWTYIFQVCFSVEGPIADSANFCPPVVWDLELNPANGGYLAGDDGVVITVVNDPPAMSGPSFESVVQFNWMYVGNGNAPPYGAPVENECISLFCEPVITCAPDVTIDCAASIDPSNTGSATAFDPCNADVTISYSDETLFSNDCNQTYIINRTWIAVNDCNIADTCVQIISVIDTTGPVVICPDDIVINCDESTDPSNTGQAVASDNCDTAPTVTYIDVIVAGECAQEYTIDRIWIASDACGNVNLLCRQEIVVEDNTAPVIVCPVDLTLECSDPIPTTLATATDNCSPAGTITLSYSDINCENPIMGFTDLYDFSNWTILTPSGGSVTPMGSMEVMMESPDGIVPCPNGASVLFQIIVPSTGTLVFDWNYTSLDVDGPMFDPFGYNLNGTFFQLTDDDGPLSQSGTASVTVTAGDVFAFEQNSIDCILGEGATVVVEFFACIEQVEEVCTELIIRTHVAIDECGNESNCIQTIYLEDTTVPTITCPINLSVECTASTLPDNTGFASATDNCDVTTEITYSDVVTPSNICPQEYAIARTWLATDACGNTSTCIQAILVDDSTPPTITYCPANITIECDESTTPDNTGGFATATDNCDTAPVVTYSETSLPGNCPQEYVIVRVWTATDACGNGTNCTQVITVDDSTPPTITSCPPSLTVECDESTDPLDTGLASATDNCDTAPIVTYSDVTVAGACPQEYTITRVWTATDACGNGTNCTQVITIDDSTPPSIDCPGDITLECDDSTNPDAIGAASATDNCDTAPVVTYNDVMTPGACPQESTIARTWTATDACGNSSTCLQTIFIEDTTAPEIVCPADLTLECTDPIPTDVATATDNCSDNLTIGFTDVNCDNPVMGFTDSYDFSFWSTVIPASGGSVTTMSDNEVMLVSANGGSCLDAAVQFSITIPSTGTLVFDWDYTTVDPDGPSFDPFGYNLNGTFFQLTNDGGADVQSGSISVAVTAGDIFAFEQQSSDCILGSGATTVVEFFACIDQMEETCTQLIIRTHTAEDECGNIGSCAQTIYIVDTTVPDLTCAANITIECDESTLPDNTGLATATDNCDATPDVSYTDVTLEGNCPQEYTITRTWTAVDACGNGTNCTQVITVDDSTPPTITSCPPSLTVECDESTDPLDTGIAAATDNCDPAPVVTYADVIVPGACPQEYTITRVWTATDACGNGTNCTQVITVDDSTPPTITFCPSDVTIECDDSTLPQEGGFASATDNCDTQPVVTYADVVTPGACPQELSIARTWTATDACGNSSTCLQTVTVEDSTAPEIVCPTDLTLECTDPIPTDLATATDNCSDNLTIGFTDVACDNPVMGFTDEYDFSFWTTIIPVQGGSVTTMSDNEVMLVSPDDVTVSCDDASVQFSIIIPSTGQVVFDWNYTTNDEDGPSFDPFGYNLNGTFFQLTNDNGADVQSGSISVAVTAGDVFAFEQQSSDCILGEGATTVVEFFACIDQMEETCTQLIIRTHTAEDECGNIGSCAQTIYIVDTTVPDLTCAANITIECDESTLPDNTGLATATDNCDATPDVSYTDVTTEGACPQEYTITRTWTATDVCGNGTNCTQIITVDDSTPPTITSCPPSLTVECDESTDPLDTGIAAATDNCDPAPVVTYNDVTVAGACPQEYTITRVWTATDACGNGTNCTQVITVDDSTPPVITFCPSDVTIECDDSTLPDSEGGFASATDNCDTQPVVTYADVVTPGSCPQELSIARTWIATDACGNSSTCLQTVLVEDTTAPDVLCPADLTLECTDPIPTDVATATDNCSDNLIIGFTDVNCDNPVMGFTDSYDFSFWSTIIPAAGGSVTTMSDNEVMLVSPDGGFCDDAAVLFQITIPSTGNVVFDWNYTTVDGPFFDPFGYSLNGTFFQLTNDGGPSTQSGSISVAVTAGDIFAFEQQSTDCIFGSGATTVVEFFACIDQMEETCTQLIIRTHTAEDECGNIGSCVQTLYIVDTTIPDLTCAANITIECDEATTPDVTGLATATDNCDATPDVTYSDAISGSQVCIDEYTITRTWTATDACGNSTNCVQIISIDDSTPPVITCPADATIECTDDTSTETQGFASATDNCSEFVLITSDDVTIEGGCPQEYTIERTWTAQDECGNSSTCLQTIVIEDTTSPVVTCPEDVTIDCNGDTSPESTGFASSTDNCDDNLPELTYNDVTIDDTCPEIIERTWTSTDACGNVGTCVQTITIDDTTPPMIICPQGVTVECASDVPPVLTGGVTVSDNCGFVTVTHMGDNITNMTCANRFDISRVYMATDECGNTATCAQVIVVFDINPPSITCPAPITVSCANQVPAPSPGTVTASDNCAGVVTVTHAGDVVTNQTCVNRFTLTRTYLATDVCGNTATCTQIITVFDAAAPTITCPANITVSCASQVPVANPAAVTASDNCGGTVVVTLVGDVITNMTCANRFTVTRTYLATDACGNTASCSQIITVFDNTPPVITCPPNITVAFGNSTVPPATGNPTGSDNCGGTPTFTFTDVTIAGPCEEEFTINRTWTATDACGLIATCLQVIFVDGDCIVDLALVKTLTGPATVDAGDNVNFDITITNQGEVTIGAVVITDYIPLGFFLNDPDWTPGMAGSTGQSASITLSVANGGLDANGLNPGEFVTVQITLQANFDVTPACYMNFAEISAIFDLAGNDISDQDIDSDPDQVDTNDPIGEDDIDDAIICVLPEPSITGDGYVCPGEIVSYCVTGYNPDFTYDWVINNGGTIIATTGECITVEWADVPGGPYQISVNAIACGGCNTVAFFNVYIQGVETLSCNDHVQISLGVDCETVVLSGLILEGEAEGNNNYFVIITDENGNVIPDATLTSEHIGECFTVMVANECNDQSCWGTICVEDKIVPVIECTDVTVSCGSSLDPVFAPPVTGSVTETVNPGSSIGPNAGTVTSQDLILDIPANAIVTDVNVIVDLNHTWVGDLTVELVSPNGVTVLLVDQLCGAVDDWDNVIFDDQAGIAVTTACSPIPPALAGSVIPMGSLATMNAQSAVGVWTLIVTDQVGGDAGVLNTFALDVDYYLAVPSAPIASDACGEVTLTYTDSESGDACDDLLLTRTWTATDGSGNTATCIQYITVTPLTLENVDFPPAYVGVCGESILPQFTGWPTVDGVAITDEQDLCNIFVGYWDKELNECGGGRKIVRTWTVLDWCAVEVVEAVQVIKLTDNVGPIVTCPADYEVGTDFWYCYANVSVPKPIAYDECSEIASYQLTSSSGIVVSFGNNFVINGLELGTHQLTWTVTDECGNSTTCTFNVTVIDDVVPVANCDFETVVSLTNDGPHGVTLVPASVFDDGSYDNCGPVTFRARRVDNDEACIDFDWTTEGACIDDVPGGIPAVNSRDRGTVHRPCVPFACCDVSTLDDPRPIMVELEVTDAAGNVNYCMILVIVQDKISPFVECPADIIVSCDFWFNVQEGNFVDGEGNNDGSLDEDPLSAVFGNMYDAFRYDESIRQHIIINDPSNEDYSQPHNWGLDGWADDNCEVSLSVRVTVTDDCSGGELPANAPDGAVKLITRRFSAADGNAPGTCTQRIWVVDFDPFYITDTNCNNNNTQDGVKWPCDVTLTTCPEDLGNTGEPQIFDDACSLIGVTYEDQRFDFVDGACFKILREWAVIDWCQYDPQTGEGLWHYTQVIKVHDEDGPEFEDGACETVTLCVEQDGVSLPDNNQAFLGEDNPLASSCSVHLNLTRVVHETCSDVVNYDVKIYPFNGSDYILIKATSAATVDENNNATLSFDTRQSSIQSVRLNGLPYNSKFCGDYHRILWSVEDGCGNWSHCEYLFRLEDCKQPSPVCINGLSTVVMPVGGQVTVWAKDFNASSFDDCTPSEELLYSFSGDAYQPSFTYTCENVPAFNVELTEEIWVADGGTDDNCNGQIEWSERNKDFCTTTIVITDNNDVCGGSGPIVGGEVLTEFTNAVAQVNVLLTSPGHFFPQYITAQDGKFVFTSVPMGDDYTITPERNDEHRNGVSTLDLVRMQKHLLGKELFTSPYQYIAADANNSQGISAIDLIEIRKLILGIYVEFPLNKSWRFVEKGFPMDNENPWPFSETIELVDLGADSLMHNDFVGVKIGDVNNSAKANANQVLPRGSRRVLNVALDAKAEVEAGEVVDVTLRMPESIEGFQWTLETEGLSFESINSETMKMNEGHVGVLEDGIITMSWNALDEESKAAGQAVQIRFVATVSGNVAQMIRLTSKVTEAEAYTPEGEILEVKLRATGAAPEFALYQNEPNPWNAQTLIGFDIPSDATVTFTVFEATGKVVKTITGDFKAGYNTISLNAQELPTSGVMYYRLESGEYSASKKMVLIK